MCCGSPLAAGLKQELAERWPGDFIELYGLTEGLVTILSPEDMPAKLESVGQPCPGQRLAIGQVQRHDTDESEPGDSEPDVISSLHVTAHSSSAITGAWSEAVNPSFFLR